ncbi:hypothetical protein [Stutzerimonas zhaodongensis]|jgi:hypothetical protein|uniref:Lipoprotein n=1 Tax=Stutzerimonas zhaodongensis TaxID=1176257 RepID=A0A365PWH7_9GAMM|nr:hypothetical protein [Stutzerimonas zhaodongensis]QWV18037.1 hypothetical protein KQ248_04965 [Stutzerimonas zhaodongensis]RBA59899.1 hypothetical protein DQ403_08050 [Stutzerimonas zhaodongensis]
MKLIQAVFVAAVLLQLTGCAIGQRIDYRQAVPALNLSTDAEVAVSVVDQRPYVTAQRKNPNYVGTLRGLYYNPWNVTTLSGSPLAMDIQTAIVTGLERSGVTATRHPSGSQRAEKRGERLLVVRLVEWKSDGYMRNRFDYDLAASVYDDQGALLGESQAKWSGPINNFFIAGGDALRAVLADGEIKAALSSRVTRTQALAQPLGQPGSSYDQCMARVLRISDPKLRLQASTACDGAN